MSAINVVSKLTVQFYFIENFRMVSHIHLKR